MNTRLIRTQLAALIPAILFLLYVSASPARAQQDPALVPRSFSVSAHAWQKSFFDVLQRDRGQVVFLTSNGPTEFFTSERRKPIFRFAGKSTKNHFAILPDVGNRGYLSLAWMDAGRKNGVGIYRYTDAGHTLAAHIDSRVREPEVFQAANGHVFIGSRSGKLFRWTGKEDVNQLRLPGAQVEDSSSVYRRVKFASFPGGPVCCYCVADPRYHKRAFFDLLVASDKDDSWRTISLKRKDGLERITGPGCMTDANTFRMLLYDRWVNVAIDSGKVTEQEFPIPREGNSKVKPTKLIALPNGKLVSLWRKMYSTPRDLSKFSNDRFFRICEWKQDHWEVVRVGLDRWPAKAHPHQVDQAGGLWIAASEGALIYRSPAGKYHELDQRHHVLAKDATSLRLTGEWLWLIGSSAVHRFSLDQLRKVAANGVKSNWTVQQSRTEIGPLIIPHFRSQPLMVSGKKLRSVSSVLGGTDKEVELPPTDEFPIENKKHTFHRDSRGGWWIIPTFEATQQNVLRNEAGQWKRFDSTLEGDREIAAIEIAARHLIDAGFGPGDYAPQIAFAADGRMAVLSPEYVAISTGDDRVQIPTPNKTLTAIRFRGGRLQVSNQHPYVAFEIDPMAEAAKRKWEQVSLTRLRLERHEFLADRNQIVAKSPLQPPYYSRVSGSQALHVSEDQVGIFADDHWTVVPALSSPFRLIASQEARFHGLAGGFRDFGVDSNGAWILRTANQPMNVFAIHPPNPMIIEQGTKDLGTVNDYVSEVKPAWQAKTSNKDLIQRFRVDDGPWSEWTEANQPVRPGLLFNKDHVLSLQISSRSQVVKLAELKYRFSIDYDLEPMIAKLIENLGHAEFAVRDTAQHQLLELGGQIQSKLEDLLEKSNDPETRIRLKHIIKNLRSPGPWSDVVIE